jgi:hypothetical protein
MLLNLYLSKRLANSPNMFFTMAFTEVKGLNKTTALTLKIVAKLITTAVPIDLPIKIISLL